MATHGRGRGRGRGRLGNANLETVGNNPVSFMATLENVAAAMQATAEALGNQANHGNGDNGGNGPMTLATFLKIQPPTFGGTTNPTEADDWFQAIERALHEQQVTKDQCVEFATYQLAGKSQYWWQGTRRLLQQGDTAICRDAFRTEFYKKYFPNSVRTAKELELLQLKQGQKTVAEYTNIFEELCRFSKICQGAPGDLRNGSV
ncbi:uncharacterized protein LOC107616487 [Arachis ipaensis]|uniref:uncharacterized protein LOC107616487 n=1 Tax=Arachis ipaensis TaxID=130454 RepID=UPI0007AFD1BD|nr:uncharacterized protein LOC107616487 [Arachis ipaensis]